VSTNQRDENLLGDCKTSRVLLIKESHRQLIASFCDIDVVLETAGSVSTAYSMQLMKL